ncbi:hypothetical protein G7070_03280 [Propioniciclava coleopterorum]|uniref:Uncharacterized protein n=1 Tax=Propioniciclava coleopterorum TaxID=2714937 RepID=A0A6G7Y3U5_9ACTN|nr:hypothetical protein [Propioniciclava coleopterorum]QIK71485.1 hypothetical protein G7070_03280 [Propioniciclava coleopterorum]
METLIRTQSEAFLANVLTGLDDLDPNGLDRTLLTDAERVTLAEQALSAAGRLQALAGVLVAEADRVAAPQTVVGWAHCRGCTTPSG